MDMMELLKKQSERKFYTIVDDDGNDWVIRSWTERDKTNHELSMMDKRTNTATAESLRDARTKAIAISVVDPGTKELAFATWNAEKGRYDYDQEAMEALSEARSFVTNRLYAKILKVNGFEDKEVDEYLGE